MGNESYIEQLEQYAERIVLGVSHHLVGCTTVRSGTHTLPHGDAGTAGKVAEDNDAVSPDLNVARYYNRTTRVDHHNKR